MRMVTGIIVVLYSTVNPTCVSTPGVHWVADILERWMLDTHQVSVRAEHLQSYLEVFTFYFFGQLHRVEGWFFGDFCTKRLALAFVQY